MSKLDPMVTFKLTGLVPEWDPILLTQRFQVGIEFLIEFPHIFEGWNVFLQFVHEWKIRLIKLEMRTIRSKRFLKISLIILTLRTVILRQTVFSVFSMMAPPKSTYNSKRAPPSTIKQIKKEKSLYVFKFYCFLLANISTSCSR